MRFFLLIFLITFSLNSYADLMRVIFLGTGTPRPDIERFSQSILVESGNERLLFDVGRGAVIRMSQANIPIQDIDKVFLTHLHSDHVLGMPDLIMTGWIYQRSKKLNIFGPIGTKDFIYHIKKTFDEDVKIRTVPPEGHSLSGLNTEVFEIEEGLIYKNGDLKVYAFEVDHGGGVKHGFGFKITNGDQTIIISGDTNLSRNLIENAKDCDLLIHEIAGAPKSVIEKNPKVKGLMNYHTTVEEMATILNETKPRLTILTHVLALGGTKPDTILTEVQNITKNKFKIKMAYDLMAIDVKENLNIYSMDYSNVDDK